MKISVRLQKIAEMVKYNTVADIGTDHGYLPIYLVQSELANKVLATDVNPGPLASAQRSIIDCRPMTGEVSTCLCDGLDGVNPVEYETCVISGMGGRLIIDIIRRNMEIALGFKQLVLSPQRDVTDVRRFLHQSNFHIDDEEMIEEKSKFYNILDVSPGNRVAPYDEKGYIFGEILLRKKSDVLIKSIEIEIAKLKKIGRCEHEKYIQLHEEVLKCLSR